MLIIKYRFILFGKTVTRFGFFISLVSIKTNENKNEKLKKCAEMFVIKIKRHSKVFCFALILAAYLSFLFCVPAICCRNNSLFSF